MKELWFNLYPRSSSSNIYDSSGFEHVMVGELKGTKVSGFHSWLQFYLEERAGNLRFTSMVSSAEVSHASLVGSFGPNWSSRVTERAERERERERPAASAVLLSNYML